MRQKSIKNPPKLFLLIFILIGIYFFLIGIYPIKIEINPRGGSFEAQIHRKSMIPPFKDIHIIIPNFKQAIITSSKSSKGQSTFRVELESYNGQYFPVTQYYSSGYNAKSILQTQINNAVKNSSHFEYTIRQIFFMLFGSMFILIPLIISIAILKTKHQGQQNQQPRFTTPDELQETQNAQDSEYDDKKYKEINDLIIR